MSSQKPPFCSDEELLNELQKLGYDDVPPDVFQIMKNDLSELVEKDLHDSEVSDKEEEITSASIRYTSARKKYDRTLGKFSEKLKPEPFKVTHIESNHPSSLQSSALSGGEDLYSKYRNRYKHFKLSSFDSQQSDRISSDNVGSESPETDSEGSSISVVGNHESVSSKYKEIEKLPEILNRSPEVNSSNQKLLNSSALNQNISKVNESINNYRNHFKLCSSENVFKSHSMVSNTSVPYESISKVNESINKYRNRFKSLSSQEVIDSDQNLSMGSLHSGNSSQFNESISNYRSRFKSRLSQEAISSDQKLLSNVLSPSEKILRVNESLNKYRSRFKSQVPREIFNPDQKFSIDSNENVPNVKDSIINYRNCLKVRSPEGITSSNQQVLSSLSLSEKTSRINESLNKYRSRFMHQSPQQVNTGSKLLSCSIPKENISTVNESINKYRSRFKNLNIHGFGSVQEDTQSHDKDEYDSPDIESETSPTPSLILENKLSYEKADYGSTDIESEVSSASSLTVKNKIKRKVLRHKNGQPVITEVLRDIPGIFSNSYPGTESFENTKSFSRSDLSWKPNGSIGFSVLSPNTFDASLSTYSLSTPRSLQLRYGAQRKKKTDPVSMYNYYKKYWNTFKPPGEKTHDKLRWAVRDRMLDYNI